MEEVVLIGLGEELNYIPCSELFIIFAMEKGKKNKWRSSDKPLLTCIEDAIYLEEFFFKRWKDMLDDPCI